MVLCFTFLTVTLAVLTSRTVSALSKRGLPWADASSPQDMLQFNKSGTVAWVYNWGPSPDDLSTSGLEFVPMQWNGVGMNDIREIVVNLRSSEVLIFNEPDLVSQSNINPTDAANLWLQYAQPLKQLGIRLGGPAVTNADSGRAWLRDFFAACTGCEVDFLPLHWYGDSIGDFYDYIFQMNGEFGLPLWITEFASTASDDASVADFMNQTITFLDTLTFIERYSWFGAFRQDGTNHYAMLDSTGALNSLGKIYIA